MIATLQPGLVHALGQVRSQRAGWRLEFFRRQFEELGKQPLLDRFGYRLDDLRQPLRVTAYDARRAVEEIRERERWRENPGTANEKGEDDKLYRYRGGGLQAAEEAARPRPLSELNPAFLVLLGDPGMGKTEWLKKQAREATRRAWDDLRQSRCTVDEAKFPLFATLPELGRALAEPDRLADFLHERLCQPRRLAVLPGWMQFAAAILSTIYAKGWVAPEFLPELWNALSLRENGAAESAIERLYLDSLDEVSAEQRPRLLECLGQFHAHCPALSIYLTSRLVGYSSVPLPVTRELTGAGMELELCQFEPADTEQFISLFYADKPAIGTALQSELRAKPGVAGLARNSLMVTLLCMAFDPRHNPTPLRLPASRGAIYETVLKGLLGDWRGQRNREVPAGLVAAKLRLLAELAWVSFPRETIDDEMLNEFFWGEAGCLNALPPGHPLARWSAAVTPQDDLLGDGVLVRLGGTQLYAFLHLTFQEYLTARACAAQRERVERALQRIYDPVWHEVLILLGRLL